MKIAVICPIGPLDRYGYQHIYEPVVKNLSTFATTVYIISTTRNRANVDSLLNRFSNIIYISNETTWYDLNDKGLEDFSLKRLYENIDLAIQTAKHDGMDCSLTMSVNQYIPEWARNPLKKVCQNMLEARKPFDWYYRRNQLANSLFHTDYRIPDIYNLKIDNPYHKCIDGIEHKSKNKQYKIDKGNFFFKNSVATVDCGLEMTLQDMSEKYNYVRCYSDIRPGESSQFDWEHFRLYFLNKFGSKILSNDPLDSTGEEIAQRSRSDFVSWIILQHYKKPNLYKQTRSFLNSLRKVYFKR